MSKNKYLSLALLALGHSICAAQPPSAGSQLQQIPNIPARQKATPNIDVTRGTTPATPAADTVRIVVNSLTVTGAQAYSANRLLTVAGFAPGTRLTLTELRAMATRISDFYHRNGYFVAQAYLPVQDIKGGAVTIAVIEGQYGKIVLRNQTTLSDNLANSLIGGLNRGDVVASGPLENRLLLLSDVPGVQVKSTLIPGAGPGESDLIVDLEPGPRISGSFDADNAGNRYTGEYRVGAAINLNNPSGNGDLASLRVLTSGTGLQYARAAYQIQLGKAKAGLAYSHLKYKLGREFESLDANGTAQVASVFASYPLIRSRRTNLSTHVAYELRKFHDRVDSTGSVADRDARVLLAGLDGDHRDNFGGGGLSIYSLTLSSGNIDLQTATVRDFDALTARSNGHYNKLALSAMRLQRVTDSVSFYAALNGQVASKNLDISEKMELGGLYGVRAYPEGEAYGDQGYLLNLEVRMNLNRFSENQNGQLQLIGFVDTGSVTINKNPWIAGTNHRTLSGAGIGLNWTPTSDVVVKAYYAHKLGSEVARSAPDKSGRFWIQAVKYF